MDNDVEPPTLPPKIIETNEPNRLLEATSCSADSTSPAVTMNIIFFARICQLQALFVLVVHISYRSAI